MFRNINEAENYQHHYQRFSLSVLTQMADIRIFSVSNNTTGQLDKLSTKVLEIWTKCDKCALF